MIEKLTEFVPWEYITIIFVQYKTNVWFFFQMEDTIVLSSQPLQLNLYSKCMHFQMLGVWPQSTNCYLKWYSVILTASFYDMNQNI